MISPLPRLAKRRRELQSEAEAQRQQAHALWLQGRQATAPALLAGQVLRQISRHPGVIVAAVGLLVALGPSRRRSLGRLAFSGLAGLLSRRL